MSNKHKLFLILPLVALVLAVFCATPRVFALGGICSDANQTPVPAGLNTLAEVAKYCKDHGGGVPVLYRRGDGSQCVDGTPIPSLGPNTDSTAYCVGHVGYDPDGANRCDDGYDITFVKAVISQQAAGAVGATVTDADINTWCTSNHHIGYGYVTPAVTDTNSGATSTTTDVKADCDGSKSNEALQACLKDNPIITWLRDIVNFLSAGVVMVVIAMIIIGGIQYSYAGGDPNGVSEAKKKIYNAIFALIAYIFLYAFMHWLIPGGMF